MSGLDGLGWPNPEDEPKPKKTMNSRLEIKLATTPETDDATLIALDIECGGKFEAVHVQVSKRLERERNELREWASVNGVSSLAKDRDQFRARLREEQQLHVQTLNERDEAQERADTMFAKHVDILDQTRNERDAAQKAMGDARVILLDAMPDANASTKILAEMIVTERDKYEESADALVDRLGATQERMINAEREREEWKAKYIQQNKDLGCEMMDPNGTIWDYAKKVQRELTVVTKQRDQLEGRLRGELGGHPDSELWGDAGLIAATMRCLDALDTVTEQRDRLAAVLQRIRDGYGGQVAAPDCCEDCEFLIPIDEALQSLNQPTKP